MEQSRANRHDDKHLITRIVGDIKLNFLLSNVNQPIVSLGCVRSLGLKVNVDKKVLGLIPTSVGIVFLFVS